jgi:hypothetical protein
MLMSAATLVGEPLMGFMRHDSKRTGSLGLLGKVLKFMTAKCEHCCIAHYVVAHPPSVSACWNTWLVFVSLTPKIPGALQCSNLQVA